MPATTIATGRAYERERLLLLASSPASRLLRVGAQGFESEARDESGHRHL